MSSTIRPRVLVFPGPEDMSRAAADFFITLAQKAIESQGRFVAALSGGSTPRRLYAVLGATPYREKINWRQAHIFWVDERCVPKDHPESNFKLVADTLLSHIDIPKKNIHRIRGEREPERAASEYERDISSFFKSASAPTFDLILLGAGEDGHTASLFPDSAALHEHTRLAVPVYLGFPKLNRVTLTLPVLNHAAQALFLASGKIKAPIVDEIANQGNRRNYPAGLVQPAHGNTIWFVDKEAATLLTVQEQTERNAPQESHYET